MSPLHSASADAPGATPDNNNQASTSAAPLTSAINNAPKEHDNTTSLATSAAASPDRINFAPREAIESCNDLVVYNAQYKHWMAARAHHGAIRICEGAGHTTAIRACEGCVEITHQRYEEECLLLLKEKWLPLCQWCTDKVQDDLSFLRAGDEYVGCKCPIGNPNWEVEKEKHEMGHVKFLCRQCRQDTLEAAIVRHKLEVEMRQGPNRAGYDEGGNVTSIFIGMRCFCGSNLPVDTKFHPAMRCGGCGGVCYDESPPGTPF
jgi:hypothetical protein